MRKISITVAAFTLPLILNTAQAAVTQDCILKGTVDKKKAEQLNTPLHVAFQSAQAGDQGPCEIGRRNKSRRIQFKAPSTDELTDAPHGATVKYRFIEREGSADQWQLMERSDTEAGNI